MAKKCLQDASLRLQDGAGRLQDARNRATGRRQSLLQDGTECQQDATIIQILIFSNQPTLLEKAERIFHRDMSSQLIHCFRAHGVVVAYLSPLNLFNPSECLSFYHYHLDRSLQGRAAIYLTTQSSEGGTR